MDLHFNRGARFTRWLVEAKLLKQPLVVIDIGVFGGENPRWHVLDEYLVLHGFDAIKEEVDRLRSENKRNPNRHYHWMAAGNEDGEREFHFNAANPTSSSIYEQGEDRAHHFGDEKAYTSRRVPVRRLDNLISEGALPRADFLKVDVEGFEKDVLDGAASLLGSDLLGVEIETNFSVSPSYPLGHFATIQTILLEHHLLVFDLAYNRVPRESYQQALLRKGIPPVADQVSIGKVSTVNALFLRDLIDEAHSPHHYPKPPREVSIDKLLKAMVIYELYGLNDIALDAAAQFRTRLSERIDVDHAIDLLADRACRSSVNSDIDMPWNIDALRQRVHDVESSSSWRMTAPLRRFRAAATKLISRTRAPR